VALNDIEFQHTPLSWARTYPARARWPFNDVDRSSLSVAPRLLPPCTVAASQLGILLAAFFWSYTAMQFASASLADRFEVNYVAAEYFLWTFSAAVTVPFAASRVLLGMREMALTM
jgi:ACS family D-galactonate transporter-like MFS transporter